MWRGDTVEIAKLAPDVHQTLIALRDGKARSFAEACRLALNAQDYDQAEDSLALALRLRPDYPMALVLKGNLDLCRKRYGSAARSFDEALGYAKLPEAYFGRAQVHLLRRDTAAALGQMAIALNSNPN